MGAAAGDNCTHKVWTWTVDKKAALELQQSVDEGHQPWRMDDVAAVAAEAVENRKKEWVDYNTVLEVSKVVSQSRDTALRPRNRRTVA
jgi:hypothetical protein